MANLNKNSHSHDALARLGITALSAPRFLVPAGVLIIAVAVSLVYFPSLKGGFIWDDEQLLTENQLIAAPDGLYRLWFTTESADYWPATYTTFWLEWRLWGKNPTGYRVTNLILHIIDSLLIWLILWKLSFPGAFLAALIFAVHPVNVESVAWIAQRKNLMAMLFFLLSILCFLKSEEKTPGTSAGAKRGTSTLQSIKFWYWLSLLMFLLAMLGKGSVAVLPVILLGIIWWLRPVTKWDIIRIIPYFLFAAVMTGVNVWFQTHDTGEVIRTAGFLERVLGAASVVWFYLYKAIVPINLAFVYPQWNIDVAKPLWWLPLLALFVVTAMLWLCRNSWSRPFLFAWGFFCVALVPVMGLMDVYYMRYSLVADHYQHIAIIGVVALAGTGLFTWDQHSRGAAHWVATIAIVTAVGSLALLTWRQSGIYSDEITLLHHSLEKNPASWMAHNNLGKRLLDMGKVQASLEHFRQALRIKADHFEANNNMGNALLQLGLIDEAFQYIQQALQLRSNHPEARYNLANALYQLGRPEEAIEHYKLALQGKPNHPEAHNMLGVALAGSGRISEAVEHYEQAIKLKPDFFEAYNNLGVALTNLGRWQGAIESYEQALRIKPDYPEAHVNLGRVLVSTGRSQEAIDHYRQALRLRSDFLEAYFNLALAHASLSQSSAAVTSAQRALELARLKGQIALVKRIEDWLDSYRASLLKPPNK